MRMLYWFIDFFRRRKADAMREWRHVPNPQWAAKRGWREYW